MRVYAESNFVLEVILQQESHRACEELITLAQRKAIELVLPAFAILEPHETIVRRRKDWKAIRERVNEHARQLERTAWISADVPQLRSAAELLLRTEQEAADRFVRVRNQLLDVARTIPIDSATIRDAEAAAVDFGLQLPDALMLASVLADAQRVWSQSIFLNRNTQDFNDRDIKRRLAEVNCTLVPRFDGGLARVRQVLAADKASPS